MTGISRGLWGRASWLCSRRRPAAVRASPDRDDARRRAGDAGRFRLAQAIVLETAGPPPPDTTVTFARRRAPRVSSLRHGPPDNIVFAELDFLPRPSPDSGREVRVEVRPRPGVYGLDVATSLPDRRRRHVVLQVCPLLLRRRPRPAPVYGSDAGLRARARRRASCCRRHARAPALDPPRRRQAPRAAAGGRHATSWPRPQ